MIKNKDVQKKLQAQLEEAQDQVQIKSNELRRANEQKQLQDNMAKKLNDQLNEL